MQIRRMILNCALMSLIISLAACGSQPEHGAPAQTNERASSQVQDYRETADLNFAQTNQDLSKVKGNFVHFNGVGEKSTYSITYRFNSGNNTSFRVMQTVLDSNYAGCEQPQPVMHLDGSEGTRDVDSNTSLELTPNKDYLLDVSINHSCKELEMTFDMVVWLGTKEADPKLANYCDGKDKQPITFFKNVDYVTAWTSRVDKFLASDRICGEKVNPTKSKCSQTTDDSYFKCESQGLLELRSFTANFDDDNKTVSVICSVNNKAVRTEPYTNCRSMVMDYKQFKSDR